MIPQKPIKKERKRASKRSRLVVPVIVVLVLISIIAVICVGAPFGRPSETAEINRDVEANKEEILAETTTVNAGETYTVPEDGIYKIEVHGGRGGSNSVNPYVYGSVGSKATGYVRAYEGNQIEIRNLPGRCELRGIRTQKVSRYRRQWMCSVYGSW